MKPIYTILLLTLLLSCKSRMPVADSPTPEIAEETTVTPENLMEGSLYLVDDNNMDFNEVQHNKDSILASLMHIEFVDKATFKSKQKTVVNFWVEDAGETTKIDSVLTIRTRDSIVTFVDNPTDTEMHASYSYEGQLPILNQYVVLEMLYEDYGYMLIDKTTGKNTATFSDFPVISPDKKFIVSVHTNTYAPESGDISVNRIVNGKIIPEFIASFTSWMPQESFYCYDGFIYISVNHPKQYWLASEMIDAEHQYLRIKIL